MRSLGGEISQCPFVCWDVGEDHRPMFRKMGRDHSDLVYVGWIFMSPSVGMLCWHGDFQGPKSGEEIYGDPCLEEGCG